MEQVQKQSIGGFSEEELEKILKYKAFLEMEDKNSDEQAVYNMQMVKALGASTIEEAMSIVQASGIQKDDVNELMMEQMAAEIQRDAAAKN